MPEQIVGAREVVDKLRKLDRRIGNRLITSALRKSTTPTQRQMKALAPVGKSTHRTYKGRLVAPGFLRRSIKRRVRTDKRSGNKVLDFGVRKEAFYAKFYAQGPYTVTRRRVSAGIRKRKKRSVKPYTLRRVPFWSEVFLRDRDNIARRFLVILRDAAGKA